MTLTCNIFTFIACTTNRNQFGKQFHVCIPQPKARKLSHLNPLAAKPKFENFKVMWGWHSCCQSCPGAWLPWLLPQCRLSRSPACYLLTFHILFHDVRISYAAKQHIRIHTWALRQLATTPFTLSYLRHFTYHSQQHFVTISAAAAAA